MSEGQAMTDSTMREAFEAWVIGPTGTGRPWRCTEPGFVHQYEDSHTELAWRAWTASRNQALEEAAQAAATVLDMREEAKAERESREAKGTEDEISRLHHWMTVSTYNAGVRRCIAAIRALKE